MKDTDAHIDTVNPLTRRALHSIVLERDAQNDKWKRDFGKWGDTLGCKLAVLVEEVGEIAKAILERAHLSALRNELVQTAAVCVSCIEDIDNGTERMIFSRSDILRNIEDEIADQLLVCETHREKELLRGLMLRIANKI